MAGISDTSTQRNLHRRVRTQRTKIVLILWVFLKQLGEQLNLGLGLQQERLFGLDDLNGDLPLRFDVFGPDHLPETPLPDPFHHPITSEEDFSRRHNVVVVLVVPSVVVGAADGLYLSRDAAGQFERLFGGQQVLAATFDLDGQHLWFSSYAGKPSLMRIALKPGSVPETLTLPALSEDAVAYIAQNPAQRDELTVATFKRSVFLSKDAGRNWTAIAQSGSTHE